MKVKYPVGINGDFAVFALDLFAQGVGIDGRVSTHGVSPFIFSPAPARGMPEGAGG